MDEQSIHKQNGLIPTVVQDIDTKQYENYNFINILKRKGLIKEYYFSIKYKDNNSGNLTIGDLPHNYDDSYNDFPSRDDSDATFIDTEEFKNGINADKDKFGKGTKLISVRDILNDKPITYDSILGAIDANNSDYSKNTDKSLRNTDKILIKNR